MALEEMRVELNTVALLERRKAGLEGGAIEGSRRRYDGDPVAWMHDLRPHEDRCRRHPMIGFVLWLLLLMVCWPLALLAIVLYPLVWLLMLPLRIVGLAVEGVFELLRAIILMPARVLGGRR